MHFALQLLSNTMVHHRETLTKCWSLTNWSRHLQRKVVTEMYERAVTAGEILIKEGDTGLAASELYVVKSGKFEVSRANLCRHHATIAVKCTSNCCQPA